MFLLFAGVAGLIIWGSEESEPGRKDLLAWFKNQSVIFGTAAAAATPGGKPAAPRRTRSLLAAAGTPPILRDGPIPKYKECGL